MFHANMAAAIDGARTLAQADELARAIWQAHASAAIDDDGAQSLAERLHERRKAIREGVRPIGIPAGRASLFPPKPSQRSPDRAASRDRRRLLACSGPLPPALAARFTIGQLAVLRIIGDEVAATGTCALCLDAIAARAGVCRRLAQTALRLAEGDGLLVVQERRREGRKNDTNVLRIISREWMAWLRRRGRNAAPRPPGEGELRIIGCKEIHPTGKRLLNKDRLRSNQPSQSSAGRQGSFSVASPRIARG